VRRILPEMGDDVKYSRGISSDPTAKTLTGEQPIRKVCRSQDNPEILRLLLRAGTNINIGTHRAEGAIAVTGARML
jgi:hypothetical protein